MCCRSVAVQFSVKIFIFAVHFNSFSIEVNGTCEILLVVFIVTLILINLCNCYDEANEIVLGISFLTRQRQFQTFRTKKQGTKLEHCNLSLIQQC